MSKRALVLLIGLVAIGNFEALAVTAPQIVEPREDLFDSKPKFESNSIFESRPRSPTADANPGVAQPPAAPPPAAAAAEPPPSGNPLWAIPLARLTATRERPVFSPSRHRAAVAAMAKPAPVPVAPPAKPPEPEKPQLSLVGTVARGAGEGIGLFMSSAEKTVVRLKTGENHKGWILRAVRPRQAVLAKGLENAVLDLPPPDMKAGPAALAVAPPAAPVVPTPALSTSSSSPTSPALAVNAVGATIVAPPPPPAPVNPFQKGDGRLPQRLFRSQ
jgi:hypothetical protein